MKKTLSVFLTLVMLLTFVPITAFAASAVAMTVTPSASSVDVGDSVTVTVAISGNAEKAVGMQASLTYDPTVLQYESCTPKNVNFKTSDFNLYSAGNFVMLYEDPTVTGVDLASDIVEVTFTALAPSDSSSVALNIVEFYDNNDEDFSLDMTGASTSIAVTAAMLEAATPTFDTDLSAAAVSYTVGETPADLTVVASATDAGVITYQWYNSSDNLTYAPIGGATSANYTPSTLAAGTTYYHVVATNTLGGSTATATCSTATVTVNEAEEEFSYIEDFNNGQPANWLTLDADGDGKGWNYVSNEGHYVSWSWYENALTPDNYLISPVITVPSTVNQIKASWSTLANGGDEYCFEKYAVYIVGADNITAGGISALTPVFAETLDSGTVETNSAVLNVTGFADQSIRIVFRHYDCTDQSGIEIDDLVITADESVDIPSFTANLSTSAVAYTVDQAAEALTVEAVVTDSGDISYQWYSSKDNSTFSPIDGKIGASYTPPTSTAGTTYYYVIATNTLGGSTATATSSTATVTVNEAGNTAWDGTAETSWYNTTDTYYELSTPEQFAGFAKIVSGTVDGIAADSFAGKTVLLMTDLDLGSQPWTAVGLYSSNPFAGTFDGNGKKISNFCIGSTSANYTGALFSYNTGVIANLTIDSGSVTANHGYAGAFIARNDGSLVNCLNKADITSSNVRVGGLVGYNSNGAFIIGCANMGSVTSSSTSTSAYVGGIAAYGYGTIGNCYNSGDVTSTDNKNRLGGIAGIVNSTTIYNCYNSGRVISSGSDVGALFGYASDRNISNGTAVLTNNLFLQTDTVNSGLCALGVAITLDEAQAKAADTATLQAAAATLGDAFAADSGNINNGSPVLAWQASGVYPPVETKNGLSVTGVSTVENGQITVTLNKSLSYISLAGSDFSATIQQGEGEAQTLTITGVTPMGTSALLTFDALAQPTADTTYTISVGCGAETKQSGSLTMYGLEVASLDSVNAYNLIFGDAVVNDPIDEYTEITLTLNNEPQAALTADVFSASYSVGGGTPTALSIDEITADGAVVTLKTDVIPDTTSERSVTVSVSYNGGTAATKDAVIAASLNWSDYVSKPQNGDGSGSSPYRLGTAGELAWFAGLINGTLTDGTAQDNDACAVLTADIELNDTTSWESWDENTADLRVWCPIGNTSYVTNSNSFRGTFDGHGYTVSGLYINYETSAYNSGFGLFDKANFATIKNVNVEKSYIRYVIEGYGYIGGVASTARDTTIENCATSDIKLIGAGNPIGGVVARINVYTDGYEAVVSGCTSDATIVNSGGLAYYTPCAGGVIGRADFFNSNCTGAVSVSGCYFTGTITANTTADCMTGGVVGETEYKLFGSAVSKLPYVSALLEGCYSVGTISGGTVAGITNLIGDDIDLSTLTYMTNCYYLSTGVSDTYATPKTEAELKDSAILDLLGTSFNFVDGRNDGYPMLKWQTAEAVNEVEIPTFTLTNNSGMGMQFTVAIFCATEGATIYYTTDGTAPTTESAVYSEPFEIHGDSVSAFAVKEGLTNSAINVAAPSQVVAPTASPDSCTLTQAIDITISSGTDDAAIYYTNDGTDPIVWDWSDNCYVLDESAVLYSGVITVAADMVIKAAAIKQGMYASDISTFTYYLSWSTNVQQPQGEGTSDSPYLIGTAEELAWFAALVNGDLPGTPKNTAACARMTTAVDLGAHTWKAIDGFTGVFDGDGNTVANLGFAADATGSLFKSNSGTIKNVGTVGRTLESDNQNFAVLCNSNSGTVSGCWNDVDIDTWGTCISGLVGANGTAGVVEFCYNTGDIIGQDDPYGGTTGPARNLGGICGVNGGIIRDCYNTGVFTSMTRYGYQWGGICGCLADSGSIIRCYNMGMLVSGKSADTSYGDWGSWHIVKNAMGVESIGSFCGLVTGYQYNSNGYAFSVTDSYFLEDLTLTGSGLQNVPLSRLYWANTNKFAGFKVSNITSGYIDATTEYGAGSTYYAFYDATNDQVIGVKLAGENDDDGYITLDAQNLDIDCSFDGTQGQYMTSMTKTVNIVTVPANTTHITFTGTDKIQDITLYISDKYADEINSANVANVLAQVQATWPAQYDNIAAAINRYLGDTVYEPVTGEVRVIIENTTFIDAAQSKDGQTEPDWTGTLLDTTVSIDESSTVMSAIVDAAEANNITVVGASSGYIESINGLAQMEGAGAQSGWMGTLGDWFVNAGFGNFTAENGDLQDGDVICVLYSNANNGGEDLGASWYNNNKNLINLAVSTGTLTPAFDGATTSYTLALPEGTDSVTVTPEAANKNFQVRIKTGNENINSMHWGARALTVSNGDVITVTCGNPTWPSMNNGDVGSGGENVPAETYTIMITNGSGTVNTPPVIQSGVLNPANVTVSAGDAYTLDLRTIFEDADEDTTLTYAVSVNGADAVSTDADYSYTPEGAGITTLAFKAGDGELESEAYNVTLTAIETSTLTFKVAPSGINVTFYATTGYDSDGYDLYDNNAPLTATDGGVVSGYHIYTVKVPVDTATVSFRGTDGSENVLGGMSVDVSDATNGVITLRQFEGYINSKINENYPTADQAVFIVKDAGDKTATYGSTYVNSGSTRFRYLLFAGGNAELYSYNAVPQGELAQTYGTGVKLNQAIFSGTFTYAKSLTIPMLHTYTITAPSGADVQMFNQLRNFYVEELNEIGVTDNGDGTASHVYRLPGSSTSLSYRVSMSGYITKAGYISSLSTDGSLSVEWTDSDASPATRENDVVASVAPYVEDSLLLNVNSQNYLELGTGETYRLRAYRVWEIINTITTNIMIEPDFHYTVLSGSDVVSINTVTAGNGNASGNWLDITAAGVGTAIIEISYDAIKISGGSYSGTYAASDSQRTGLVVIHVGPNGSADIDLGLASEHTVNGTSYSSSWDAEYDTVYFNGASGEFSFTPSAAGGITSVEVLNNPTTNSDWTTLVAAEGVYTATITPGNNILRITSGDTVEYQIVRGAAVTTVVENVTAPGEPVHPGDTAKVSFNGLYMPIPKFSGIYNPGYGVVGQQTVYVMPADMTLVSTVTHNQYKLRTNNGLTVKSTLAGEYTLTGGFVYFNVMGIEDPLGGHRLLTDTGVGANFSAVSTIHTRGILPDVTLAVTDLTELTDVTVTPTVAGDTASGTVDLTGASVETGAAFTVTATTGNDDVTRLDLTFTNETLAALANAGNLVIHTDFGDITLDADAIANLIANAGGGDVTLTVEAKAASELPEAQQGAAANADILLEISLTSGGSPIAFNNGTNGTMTIEVPFTPSSPDIDVTVYYIDETGTRTAMTSSCADGKVTFATTHLSLYVIEEEKSAYTVNLTTANTDRNVGETITVGLNVSGAADYASLQTTVSYDKTKVSYTGNTLTGFTVTNNAAAGTLTISRFGSTTSTGLQGYLTFTVNPDISTGSSEAAFSVASAVVGVRGDPSDAAAAGTGTDISVDVHNLTVSFEAGDHVTMETATAYVKYGVAGLYTTNAYETTFTYPNPSADTGCTLDAPMWTDGTDRTSFGIISETVFTANAVYTATATVDVYDIVYELDGGTNDTSNPATYSYGDSFTLAYPAKENCTFVGWYADDSFTTPVTGISATDTGDKTFYARWQGEVTITLPSQVTVVSGVTDGKANYGTDVVFTVTADPGYTLESVGYTVGSGSAVTLTVSGGQYTIPGTALTDDVTVTVTQHVTGSVTFITFEDYKGAPMGFQVLLLEATVPEGYKYQYDGTDLFKSDKYAKYACFVPADVDAETALYTIACVAGTAPVINYDGNANQSPDGAVTSADAQLIYDLYTGLIKYVSDSDFSKVSEKMRLAADINGDGTVDTADAQIVVNSIHNIV